MMENIGPYLRSRNKTSKIMINLMVALLPLIIFSVYKNGIIPYINGNTGVFGIFYPLIFILVPAIISCITEMLYLRFISNKKDAELLLELKRTYSVFPGIFLALILPINTPILIVMMGAFFATFVGKLLFGGFGNNIFNPALIGCLFIMTTYGAVIASHGGYMNAYEIDTITSPTPLSNIALVEGVPTYEAYVKPYGTLTNFFVGTIPGAVGETSALLCIIGFIYLTITKTIKWRIPVVYIGTVFIINLCGSLIGGYGLWYPVFQILSGGLMLGAIYMATDPVTSPVTHEGQIMYGLCLGILTLIFRTFTSYPEGVLTSILTMNLFVFLIDKLGSKSRFKKINYYVIIGILVFICLGISYQITTKFNDTNVGGTDPNYNIISRDVDGKKATYVVTQIGNGGPIKAKLVIENDVITSFEVLEHNETAAYYKLVTETNYILKLINNESVDGVDTISGATISSAALKKMAINTLKDYKNGGDEDITNVPSKPTDTFSVLNKVTTDENTIYTVSEKSFGGDMEALVTITDNRIVSIVPTSYHDTCLYTKDKSEYYECPSIIEELDYINTIILNQAMNDNVDTVAGVTVSSTALKNIMIKTLNYHMGDGYEE